MLFNLILVFCVIQSATPITYKYNKYTHLRPPHRNNIEFNYNKHIQKPREEDSSELSSESRRLFDWIKKVLHKNGTSSATPRIPSYEEILNQEIRFRKIEANLTETLDKLSHILTQILNIVKYARYHTFDDIRELLPTKSGSKTLRQENRFKRDLNTSGNVKSRNSITKKDLDKSNNDVHEEIESKNCNNKNNNCEINPKSNLLEENDQISSKGQDNRKKRNLLDDFPTNLKSINTQYTRVKRDTTELSKDAAEATEKSEADKKLEVKHDNISAKVEKDSNEKVKKDIIAETDTITNGRRSLIPITTNNEVKNRLFKYIDEAFAEIVKKIDSLKQTKQLFSKNVSYRVGYIISNIDTLQINMSNMQRDMDRNKYVWDDKKILNLYDTVKVSNRALTDLLEILKIYVEKSLN